MKDKIIRVDWFTSISHGIGIVVKEDGQGKRKAYIGVGDGHDEGLDVGKIMDYGGKVGVERLKAILKALEGGND